MAKLPRGVCIYCGGIATTKDHVPPKFIWGNSLPQNLFTVPSCQTCNQASSLDEQYFYVFLSYVSSSGVAESELELGGKIDRTLDRSVAFEEMLVQSLGIDEKTGRATFFPDQARLDRVTKKITRGLFALQFGAPLPENLIGTIHMGSWSDVEEGSSSKDASSFMRGLDPNYFTIMKSNVFAYAFVQDLVDHDTIWCITHIHDSIWTTVRLSISISM